MTTELSIALSAGGMATVIFFSVSAVLHRDRLIQWLKEKRSQE